MNEVFNVEESSELLSASSNRHAVPINALRSIFTIDLCYGSLRPARRETLGPKTRRPISDPSVRANTMWPVDP